MCSRYACEVSLRELNLLQLLTLVELQCWQILTRGTGGKLAKDYNNSPFSRCLDKTCIGKITIIFRWWSVDRRFSKPDQTGPYCICMLYIYILWIKEIEEDLGYGHYARGNPGVELGSSMKKKKNEKWSSGQHVWLLIMRSRVRSPALPQILNVD